MKEILHVYPDFRMIDYNEDWLFSTIFRLDGSVALRSSLFAFPAAMLLGPDLGDLKLDRVIPILGLRLNMDQES